MKSRFSLIIIMILCLLCTSCGKQENLFVLNGTVSCSGSDSIIVIGFDSRFEKTDTIRYENDGIFTYQFTTDTVVPLILLFSDGYQDVVFAEKNKTCELVRDTIDSIASIRGSFYNDALSDYKFAFEKDTSLSQTINRIDSLIVSDPFSELSPYLIYKYVVCSGYKDDASISALIKKMSGTVQDNSYIVDLKNELAIGKRSEMYLPDISVRDIDGNKKAIKDFSDTNHLLLYIWASWDEQSRVNRKELQQITQKYNDKQLVVADVSIDTNIDRWKKTVKEDSLSHGQYIDINGYSSKILSSLLIEKIPCYIVLTPQERVLLCSDSISEVIRTLDSTLKDKKKVVRSKKNN